MFIQFTFFKDVPEMLTDILLRRAEQVRKLRLGQPDGLVLKPRLDPRHAVFSLIDDQLSIIHSIGDLLLLWLARESFRDTPDLL